MENKNIYRMDKQYAVPVFILFWFFALWALSDFAKLRWMTLPLIIFILYYNRTYLEFTDKGIIINKWAIIHSEQDIRYTKINNVELKRWLWIYATIKIFVGNDKPIFFKNIEKWKEVRKRIIDELEKLDAK